MDFEGKEVGLNHGDMKQLLCGVFGAGEYSNFTEVVLKEISRVY
jgi:hypothetical protein